MLEGAVPCLCTTTPCLRSPQSPVTQQTTHKTVSRGAWGGCVKEGAKPPGCATTPAAHPQ